MLSPESAGITISKQVHLSQALLSLGRLLSRHAGEERGHDNLLPTAVDEAREVIVEQLELSGLIGEECGIVRVDAAVRADLVDLMARILVAVFQAKGERVRSP